MKPNTPLPWVLSSSVIICDKEARVIASLVPMDVVGVSAKEQFANAPYIVHACNSYPRLVKALRNAIKGVDWEICGPETDALLRDLGEELGE